MRRVEVSDDEHRFFTTTFRFEEVEETAIEVEFEINSILRGRLHDR